MEQIQPFLTLPFGKDAPIEITEGWYYTEEEHQIHGGTEHRGIDFATPYGAEVFAPCDGLAVRSYSLGYVEDESSPDGYRYYQEKLVGCGLGHFVQIFHPKTGLFVVLGHLSWTPPEIHMLWPERVDLSGIPYIEWWPPQRLFSARMSRVISRNIRKGDLIGRVGDSGLAWGYQESPTLRPDCEEFPSWDEPHVHFRVCRRDEEGNRTDHFDPYNLYAKNVRVYQDLSTLPEGNLWLPNEHNLPRFAVE